MNAMLLHLDEELTNDRPGHSYLAKYNARDLAFWVQFYSLFYDRIFVPANFLTDSDLMPDMLQVLGASDSQSLLQFEAGPLQILWDEQRFPEKDFSTLVGRMAKRDTLDVSLRNISRSKETATICDKYLRHKILRRTLSVDYYNDASVRLMRERVFSPSQNWALTSSDYERLSRILEKIVERGGPIGYGRDFFYTLFGYCDTAEGRQTARRFADIAREVGDLQHLFLSSVDYASHTVKAVVAEAALQEDVAALLPNQYQRVFRRSHTDRLWHSQHEEEAAVAAKVEHRYLLDRDRIIGMTADQFVSIRIGDEYEALRKALDSASTPEGADHQDISIEIAAALHAYLKKIESVLNPRRYYTDHLLEIVGRTRLSEVGLTILVAIGVAGKLILPEPASGVFDRGVELLTVHHGVAHSVEKVREKTTHRKEFPTEGFQLGRDVHVKLLKNC